MRVYIEYTIAKVSYTPDNPVVQLCFSLVPLVWSGTKTNVEGVPKEGLGDHHACRCCLLAEYSRPEHPE